MEGIIPALSVLTKKGVTKTQYIVDITYSTWFATQIAFNGAMAMYAISSRNSASTLVDIAEDKTVISYNTNLLNAKSGKRLCLFLHKHGNQWLLHRYSLHLTRNEVIA